MRKSGASFHSPRPTSGLDPSLSRNAGETRERPCRQWIEPCPRQRAASVAVGRDVAGFPRRFLTQNAESQRLPAPFGTFRKEKLWGRRLLCWRSTALPLLHTDAVERCPTLTSPRPSLGFHGHQPKLPPGRREDHLSHIFPFVPLYLQKGLGFSPLDSGWPILLAVLPAVATSVASGRLADQIGARKPLLLGLLLNGGALLAIAAGVGLASFGTIVAALLVWGATPGRWWNGRRRRCRARLEGQSIVTGKGDAPSRPRLPIMWKVRSALTCVVESPASASALSGPAGASRRAHPPVPCRRSAGRW